MWIIIPALYMEFKVMFQVMLVEKRMLPFLLPHAHLHETLINLFSLSENRNIMICSSILIYCLTYLCRLEKDYSLLKSKENEDQVELRVSYIRWYIYSYFVTYVHVCSAVKLSLQFCCNIHLFSSSSISSLFCELSVHEHRAHNSYIDNEMC